MSFPWAPMTFRSVKMPEPYDLRRMEGRCLRQEGSEQQRAALRPMRFPYVLSKLMILLFKNNSFGAAGEIRTS